MQLTGTVKKILEIETGTTKSGKEWKRQTFLLEYQDGNFTKQTAIQVKAEPVLALLKHVRINETVTCEINVESREWNDRFFTDVTAWKITKGEPINF